MTLCGSTATLAIERMPATNDDGLYHICAIHDYETDHEGLCERGIGCRSLCGRDIAGLPYSDYLLPGEQDCLVCHDLDVEDSE